MGAILAKYEADVLFEPGRVFHCSKLHCCWHCSSFFVCLVLFMLGVQTVFRNHSVSGVRDTQALGTCSALCQAPRARREEASEIPLAPWLSCDAVHSLSPKNPKVGIVGLLHII